VTAAVNNTAEDSLVRWCQYSTCSLTYLPYTGAKPHTNSLARTTTRLTIHDAAKVNTSVYPCISTQAFVWVFTSA